MFRPYKFIVRYQNYKILRGILLKKFLKYFVLVTSNDGLETPEHICTFILNNCLGFIPCSRSKLQHLYSSSLESRYCCC